MPDAAERVATTMLDELFPADSDAWRDDVASGQIAADHAEHAERKARARRVYAIMALEARLFPPAKLAALLDVHWTTLYRWRDDFKNSQEYADVASRRRIGMN